MREILFRGKLTHGKRKGQWAYGSLIQSRQGNITINGLNEDCRVDPDTVGQYIGVTDKYGRKIFEGDFIAVGIEYKALRIVKYIDTSFSIADDCESVRVPLSTCATKCYEIVGNKWDNKELMKKMYELSEVYTKIT